MIMNEELQALDAERDALAVRSAELREQWQDMRTRRDVAVQAQLDKLTDEQLRTDEASKRWMLKESFAHDGAHERKKALTAFSAEGARSDSYDSRKEYEADILPSIDLSLKHNQPVEELAAEIRSWSAEWALGRPDIPISILDRDCGEYGSYGGHYDVATDRMHLTCNGREAVAYGPLVDVLGYVSRELAYDGYENDYTYED